MLPLRLKMVAVQVDICRRLIIGSKDQHSCCTYLIEDVDIAEESSNLSKYSILTQAAAAMVAQANSTNDGSDVTAITKYLIIKYKLINMGFVARIFFKQSNCHG